MTDPKSLEELNVFQNREKVATLRRIKQGAVFQYTSEFLASNRAQIALHLPKTANGIEVHGTTNLPAFFAGLLPEGVMQDAIIRSMRLSADDLFSQLAISGFDAVGDVTVSPPGAQAAKRPSSAGEVRALIAEIMLGRSGPLANTLSGVQPKLSIGHAVTSSRGIVAIVKVEPPQYPGLLANEAYFMRVAKQAGLRVAEVKLEEDVLVVTRFDRVKQKGHPPRQVHVEDGLQVLNQYPFAKYSLDFLELMDAAVNLGVAKSVLLDLLRLYAYSYAIGNGDLHAKNVSFMYHPETGFWQTTPAYDLLCTLPYFDSDPFGRNMALALGEQWSEFRRDDFARHGANYGIPEKAIDSMLHEVSSGVSSAVQADSPPTPAHISREILERAHTLTQ